MALPGAPAAGDSIGQGMASSVNANSSSRSSSRYVAERGTEEESKKGRSITHRKASSKGGRRKLIGLELFSSRATLLTLLFVYATFLGSMLGAYEAISTEEHQIFPTYPIDLFTSVSSTPRDELVAAANYAPFLDPYQNGTLVDFAAKVVVQGSDIEITHDPDYTALQLVSILSADERISSFDLKGFYIDENGIDLLNFEKMTFAISIQGCLRHRNCSHAGNWGVVGDPDRTGMSSPIRVRERHPESGLPTKIEWFMYSFNQYTFSPNPVDAATWQMRYLQGGELFTVNENGNFGSCGAINGNMDAATLTANSCLQLKLRWTLQIGWDVRYLYTLSLVVSSIAFGAYCFYLRREVKRTGIPILHMQVWVLLFGFGVLLYQNPLQTISEWIHYPRPNQTLLFVQDKLTLAGTTLIIFSIICMADAPRRFTCSRAKFYQHKILFVLTWFAALWIEQFCYFPGVLENGHNGKTDFLAQAESWGKQRQRWYIGATTVRGLLLIVGFSFYLRFVGRSMQIYSQLPYGLTRADQLGFRYFTSILGLIAFVYAFTFVYRVAFASGQVELYNYDGLASAALFMNQVFGLPVRQVFVVVQSGVFLVVLCAAFMSASYWGSDAEATAYCIFENDVIRRTRMKRASNRGSSQGSGLQETSTSSVATSMLVMERARWAANLGKEAYKPYDEAELAACPPGKQDRLVDVAQFDCDMIAVLAEPDDVSMHDTHAFICRHRPTKRLCVCFRGTASQKQMLTDVQTQYTKVRVDLMTTLKAYPHMVHNDNLPAYLRDYLPTNEERRRYNLPMSASNVMANVLGLQDAGRKVGERRAPPLAAADLERKQDDNPMHPAADAEVGQPQQGGGGGGGGGGGESGAFSSAAHAAGAGGHVAVDAVMGTMNDVRTRVHYGFYSSYCTVREQIHEIVRRELTKEPGDLYVIGHSLGGALSTHCSLDMAIYMLPSVNRALEEKRKMAREKKRAAKLEEGRESGKRGDDDDGDDDDDEDDDEESSLKDVNLVMYTYGQPRVGFPRFVKAYNNAIPNAWRIVNDGDVVPTVPPSWLGFFHVGHTAVIDTRGGGSVLVDPSLLESHFKKKAGREVNPHRWGSYIKALDDCLDPIVDDDAVFDKIQECYQAEMIKRKQEGGCCYQTCCGCCIRCKKGKTVASEDDDDAAQDEEDVILELEEQ